MIFVFIRCLLYDNPLRYRNKPLPNDLSDQDLSGFDFTGCYFLYTNLTDTRLDNTILKDTMCDYQKAFKDKIKKNKLEGGEWYKKTIFNDLESITKVYPKLKNDVYKAKLLSISCALSRLPFHQEKELCVKIEYWLSILLHLKQVLSNENDYKLTCSLEKTLDDDAKNYCWSTKYPQYKEYISVKASHNNFDKYQMDFCSGLKQYKCKSKKKWGFNFYKKRIIRNIEGLKNTYFAINNDKLKKEACHIAHALSKSYQLQYSTLLQHYLYYQNRLIKLKHSLIEEAKKECHISKYREQYIQPNTTHTMLAKRY